MIAIAFMLGVLLAAAGLIGFVYYQETHLPPVRESDVIIVLGAQVKPDGTPSVALERRLTLALETYKAQPQMIIVCGADPLRYLHQLYLAAIANHRYHHSLQFPPTVAEHAHTLWFCNFREAPDVLQLVL